MRVAVFEVQDKWEQSYLEHHLHEELHFLAGALTSETAEDAHAAEAVSVSIRSQVDAAVLDQLRGLQLVTTRSSGVDHIDLRACEQRGITVCNVPEYGEIPVAEHTFGLILNLSRKVWKAGQRTRHNDFSLKGLEGFDLKGKTLGVIGAGAIGLQVIRIGHAFGMNVLAYDTCPQKPLAELAGFNYVTIDELLGESDVVSLHVPLLPETKHLINRERLERMKRGALLINTARGAIIDTAALLWALDEELLGGVGLDVLEGEEDLSEEANLFRTPESEEHLREMLRAYQLLAHENVIVTPHMAWYTREAREEILETTTDNIEAYTEGRPINVVARPKQQKAAAD